MRSRSSMITVSWKETPSLSPGAGAVACRRVTNMGRQCKASLSPAYQTTECSRFLIPRARQEFYVRFKGPEESRCIYLASSRQAGRARRCWRLPQLPSRGGYGKYMSSSPISTPTNRPASDSSTAYSTPILMSCKWERPLWRRWKYITPRGRAEMQGNWESGLC